MTYVPSVFSSIFPDRQMPWNKNSSLRVQDMYDQVYIHLIGTSEHRDTILRILGQVVIAQDMSTDVDTISSLPNTSSLEWIAVILGLAHSSVVRIVTQSHTLLEVGNDRDIKIRHPSLVEFLLDRARSQDLFIDVDQARLMLRDPPTIIKWIFNTAGK